MSEKILTFSRYKNRTHRLTIVLQGKESAPALALGLDHKRGSNLYNSTVIKEISKGSHNDCPHLEYSTGSFTANLQMALVTQDIRVALGVDFVGKGLLCTRSTTNDFVVVDNQFVSKGGLELC